MMLNNKEQESFMSKGKRFIKNPNERGQAFSVFELMIAAIVAIAILFVLLPIVTNITAPTGDAVTTIGNALSSVPAGSSTETSIFEVKPNQFVESEIFLAQGIDPCSVYFDNSAFTRGTGTPIIEVEAFEGSGECVSRFRNTSSNAVRARATVVCSTTPDRLADTLIFLNLGDLYFMPIDFWRDNPGYSKICVVILKRA